MIVRVAVLASVVLALFPQQPSRTVVIGTILRISTGDIRVRALDGTAVFRVTADTEVYKSSSNDGIGALRTGDMVSVHGVKEASGSVLATSISARSTTIRSTVHRVDRDAGEFLVGPNSGRADGLRTIRYYPCTVFGASPNTLNPGAEVLVVGLEFRDGGVDAARITIYNTDLPRF